MNNTLYSIIYNIKKGKYVVKKQKRKKNIWYQINGEYIVNNVVVE